MKKKLLLALVACSTLTALSPADARDGCGRGFFRGPYGHCRPERGGPGVVIGGPSLTIGMFYPGRGYWDGHRYWQQRERWHDHDHDGWRYHDHDDGHDHDHDR